MRHVFKYIPEVSNSVYDHPIRDVATCLYFYLNPQRFRCIEVIVHDWVFERGSIEVVIDYTVYRSNPDILIEVPNVYMRYEVFLTVVENKALLRRNSHSREEYWTPVGTFKGPIGSFKGRSIR